MKLTVLVNNCVHRPGLKAEHGLSLWLEIDNKCFLFDTGASGIVVDNAQSLGIALDKAEAIVLSHGHYDHTGGLKAVLKVINRPISVLAHPDIWQKKGHQGLGRIRDIGLPFQPEELALAQFSYNRQPLEIFPGIWLSGEIPRQTEFETIEKELVCLKEGSWIPDAIWDDQSLFVTSSKGLIVITGCAHSGIVNILTHALKITKVSKVYAIIGGFHLWHASEKRLRLTLEFLESLNPQLVITGHCTGLEAACFLKTGLGSRCQFLDVGLSLEL